MCRADLDEKGGRGELLCRPLGRQPYIAFTNNHSKFLQHALLSPARYSAFPLLPVSLLASATLRRSPFCVLPVLCQW
jgi:hypothetical protein